jgi:uncharacterized iron-regulated membrane protein
LDAGVSRGERQGVVEEVEAQIHELLSRRGSEPTAADVAAVLESLDPPEAYAPEGYRGRVNRPRPRVPQPCLVALGSAAGAIVFLLLATIAFEMGQTQSGEAMLSVLFLTVIVGAAVTGLGLWSIRRIRASAGWLTGLPAALFGALVFPLLVANLLVLLLFEFFEEKGLIIFVASVVIGANAYTVKRIWDWVSADYRPIVRT